MSESLAIETVDLQKRFDTIDALRGLNLRVPQGSIFGFLGRNGAGKTTTIKLLLGMARPTAGQARVLGLPADDAAASVNIRRRTGFVDENKALYDYMTVDEIIRFTAAFYSGWRRDLEKRYLHSFELPLHQKTTALSLGMRSKLSLLLALCRGVELLVLDEPTSGLDPAAREEVLQAIVTHVSTERLTVFFSSHQLADIDQIADHIAILDAGRTVVSGDLEDLRARYRRVQLVFNGDAPEITFHTPGIVRVRRQGRVLTAVSNAGSDALIEEAMRFGPVSADVLPVTLKEIFLESVAVED
ncbi:MAG TPA: ABC transporter ATP-binding protein [Vicinamibacterales bacterium]|nr:ABC transporter ATP-binding protein [Vicinamibacterales bacterium]